MESKILLKQDVGMKHYGKSDRIILLQLCTLLVLGLTYSLIIPPFEAPDEAAHFARAYGVAEGQFILHDHPARLVQFIKEVLEEHHDAQSLPMLNLMNDLLEQQDSRIPNLAYNSSLYSPVPYLFHALVIKILMTFGDSKLILYTTFYLCRILSVLLFVSLFYIATRALPVGAWPLFWTAVTPMALSQTGVVSTDFIVYGSAFVVICAGIGKLDDSRCLQGCFMASVFFLLMTKVTYIPLLIIPALFMMFVGGGARGPKVNAFWVGLISGLAGSITWNYLLTQFGIYETSLQIANRISTDHNIVLNPSAQFAFIVHFPLEFIKVIFRTLSTNGGGLFHQFVGVLGWLDLPILFFFIYLWTGGACASVLVAERQGSPSERASIIHGLICMSAAVLTFVAICASAYIIWMPVGSLTINLQGRYFHPVVAAILVGAVLMRPFNLNPRFETRAGFGLLFASVLINLVAVHSVFHRYGVWWSG